MLHVKSWWARVRWLLRTGTATTTTTCVSVHDAGQSQSLGGFVCAVHAAMWNVERSEESARARTTLTQNRFDDARSERTICEKRRPEVIRWLNIFSAADIFRPQDADGELIDSMNRTCIDRRSAKVSYMFGIRFWWVMGQRCETWIHLEQRVRVATRFFATLI